jgi:hypothetical protein
MASTLNEFLEKALKDQPKVNEGGVNSQYIKDMFKKIEFQNGEQHINRLVDFVRIYDKKLAREINTFFSDFYRSLIDYEKKVLKYARKD